MYNINRFIEHTFLNPVMTEADLFKLIEEALEHEFLGICVPPFWVKKAAREVSKSQLLLISVAGFPFGYSLTETKMDEISRLIDHGANEVDMVINLSAFKSNHPWTKVELAKCANLVHQYDCLLKVIIETSYLNEEELVQACKICAESGADFVKTSTGFVNSNPRIKDVKLMRSKLPSNVGVKAEGKVSNLKAAKKLIDSGADRLGLTSGVSLMEELQNQYDQ